MRLDVQVKVVICHHAEGWHHHNQLNHYLSECRTGNSNYYRIYSCCEIKMDRGLFKFYVQHNMLTITQCMRGGGGGGEEKLDHT